MFKRPDIIGSIGGCLGGAGLAILGYATEQTGTFEIGMVVLVASAIFLLFRKRMVNSSDPSLPANKSLALVIHIVFITSYALSIYAMHSSLFRPPVYFLLTSVSVAVVAVGILSTSGKNHTWPLLTEILLISFSLRFSLLYELPGLYGVDPWVHWTIIDDWLGTGHISPFTEIRFTKYVDFPVMHLNIMTMKLITFLGPKNSYYLAIGPFYVASTLFIFLLGQSLVNTRIGLLAALLISIDIFSISWGALLIPTSLGLGFFAAITWLIFKGTANPRHTLILIVLFVVLTLTHPLASLVTAIALTLYYIVNGLYRRRYQAGAENMNIRLNLVFLFWVIMLGNWAYSSVSPDRSFMSGVFLWLLTTLQTEVEFVGTAFSPSATPLGPLNRIGFLILIGLIVIGALFWLAQKVIGNRRLTVIITVFSLAAISFSLPFINIENLLTGRWLPFVSALGMIIAAEGVIALSRLLKGRILKSVGVVLILFLTATFMINSQAVNTLTPFYGEAYRQDPNRNAFFKSELNAAETITRIYDGRITTDGLYKESLFDTRFGPERVKSLDIDGENEGLVVIREYIYTHPTIDRYDEEKYDRLLASFDGSGYSTIYDNGGVKAYLGR